MGIVPIPVLGIAVNGPANEAAGTYFHQSNISNVAIEQTSLNFIFIKQDR